MGGSGGMHGLAGGRSFERIVWRLLTVERRGDGRNRKRGSYEENKEGRRGEKVTDYIQKWNKEKKRDRSERWGLHENSKAGVNFMREGQMRG